MGNYSYTGTPTKVTITATGLYDITGYGGAGGGSVNGSGGTYSAAAGAEVGGTFQLTAGEKLEIFVGGAGKMGTTGPAGPAGPGGSGYGGGGGGGTFVLASVNGGAYTLLLAAGGGGGGTYLGGAGVAASYTLSASGPGSGGGGGHYGGGGGAGFNGNGSPGTTGRNYPSSDYGTGGTSVTSATNPGAGGVFVPGTNNNSSYAGNGGFGGGGGSGEGNGSSGGGGGGYTGGTGGSNYPDGLGPGGGAYGAATGGTSFLASGATVLLAQSAATENASYAGAGRLLLTAISVQPTVTGGTAGQTTTSEAPVNGVFQGVTVADQNAGSPTETVTITVGGAGGTLTGGGVTPGATTGTYQLTGTLAQVNTALGQISFTPTAGQANTTSTTTFSIVDASSASTTASAPDTTPSVVDTDPAVAPTVTGGGATATTQNAAVRPFAAASVSDPNANSTDTLSIQVQGSGTLSGSGLGGGTNGLYTLSGTASAVTTELQGVTFTPAANGPGSATTTTFVLTDTTTASTSATNGATSVTDTVAALPPPPPVPTPAVVAFSPEVSYRDGVFAVTGTASSTAGVRAVEITAQVDGVATDLGPATVNPDGTFSFQDRIGAHTQGFITATETDGAGNTAAAQARFSLTGGLPGGRGEQDRYTADGSEETATDVFKPDGSQNVTVLESGQTFASSFFDTFRNGGVPDSTFVFNPGFGRDVVDLFRVGGADHDTLSFKGSDYGNDVATVLASARNTNAGLLITDPTASSPGGGPGTHDTLLLKGVTKQQLAANRGDIAFHA